MDPGKNKMKMKKKNLKNDIKDMIDYPSPGERKKAAEKTIERLKDDLKSN